MKQENAAELLQRAHECHTFNPKMCCSHRWSKFVDDKLATMGYEFCSKCGASCVRDRKTQLIEEYDRVAGLKLQGGVLRKPQYYPVRTPVTHFKPR